MTHVWTHTNPLPDGHTLFFTDSKQYPDLIAIADESGATPEATDDGVLWLDFERPLSLGKPYGEVETTGIIPLKTPDSDETTTITDMPTIFLLATWFNWRVNVRGILHRIEKDNDRSKIVPLAMVLEELEAAGDLVGAGIIAARFS
jgi:hypothetical protein